MELEQIKALIRDVPDFPQPGIVFKDITPLLADEDAFSTVIDLIVVHYGRGPRRQGRRHRGARVHPGLAGRLPLRGGFVPVRKEGKLPWDTERQEYSLEYGTSVLEIHRDSIQPGERVLIVDDVLATGGTAKATANLVERLGGKVVGIACLLELGFLKGREQIGGYDFFSLIAY